MTLPPLPPLPPSLPLPPLLKAAPLLTALPVLQHKPSSTTCAKSAPGPEHVEFWKAVRQLQVEGKTTTNGYVLPEDAWERVSANALPPLPLPPLPPLPPRLPL